MGGVVLCVLLVLFLLMSGGLFGKNSQEASAQATDEIPETTAPKELSVTDLLKAVMTLKDDLKTAVLDAGNGETESAAELVDNLNQKTDTIRRSLDLTLQSLGDEMPSLQSQLTNIQGLLDLLDEASESLLHPMIQELSAHPMADLNTGDGFDTRVLCEYLDFAEERMPDIEAMVAQAKTLDISLMDDDGDMGDALAKANRLLELYHQDKDLFSKVKSFLGADGDRLYVLAAQNSSEIRASGGFPGAVGTIRIQDGILTLGDFKKVYDVFSSYTPAEANITSVENRLFHGGLSAPRDADFCPDFERVAYIWALGYETGMKEPVDGVISMTPVVVQKLLKAIDEEIVLFDGTTMDGDNAVKVLQFDLYFQYFGKEKVSNAAIVADQLFADAAKKTAQKLTENMGAKELKALLSIMGDCFEDRTMMVWAKDESLQNAIVQLGWSGGLNKDPQKPQLGIYYNCTSASKMGMFLAKETEIGEGVPNEDGSYTYDVTVTLSNNITEDELRSAGQYITGGTGGSIAGSTYFFAPAGGSIGNFSTSNGVMVQRDEYHDLQLGFMPSYSIHPGKPVVVNFQVTTAPGVAEPLTISETPTLQDYR